MQTLEEKLERWKKGIVMDYEVGMVVGAILEVAHRAKEREHGYGQT